METLAADLGDGLNDDFWSMMIFVGSEGGKTQTFLGHLGFFKLWSMALFSQESPSKAKTAKGALATCYCPVTNILPS